MLVLVWLFDNGLWREVVVSLPKLYFPPSALPIKLKSSVSESKKNIRQYLRDEVVKVPIGSSRVF